MLTHCAISSRIDNQFDWILTWSHFFVPITCLLLLVITCLLILQFNVVVCFFFPCFFFKLGMKHREDRMSGRGTDMTAAGASPFTADMEEEEDPEVLYDKVRL